MNFIASDDTVTSAVSDLERRVHTAGLRGSNLCEYAENVPRWRRPIALDLSSQYERYPSVSGSKELRAGIIEREENLYGLRIGSENILITNGALHGVSLVFRSLKRPVLCQAPVFNLISEQIRASSLPIEYFRLSDWSDRVAQIRQMDARREWAVYLNMPSNPLGECPDETQIEQILSDCSRYGWAVVCDMVYDAFSFVGPHPVNLLSFAEDQERVFVVNSFSKNYGAPGLRVGWIASGRESIRSISATLERDCIAVNDSVQRAAVGLLAQGNEELINAVERGRELTRSIAGRHPALRLVAPPSGTLFLWEGDFRGVARFADYMLAAWNVLISTSENYVRCGSEHVRLPTGYPEHTIRTAMESIGRAYVEWLSLDGEKHAEDVVNCT